MRLLTAIDEHEIGRLRAAGEFLWLDLAGPSADDVATLGRVFDLHPVAIESTATFGQRPKLDEYGDYIQLVYYGVGAPDRDGGLVEVHLFVSGEYVITIHHAPCAELGQLRDRFERRPSASEQFVVYRVLDSLTDTFFPVLTAIDDEIDALEDKIIEQPTDEQLQRVFTLKRRLMTLRRVVAPQRDLAARAIEEIADLPGLEPGTRDYFRDLYDHLIRIADLLDSYRDLLTSMMDVYLSTVSNRLNAVMKQLTIIATVFLPLTFVTGFFGQNFKYLVDGIDSTVAFYVLGLGGVLVPIVGLVVYFRRRGYL